ncbi:MAG: shikimate dehydrogenase [Deltaproteobacteria bacterium]|nr:shikimate dehydrogenase [Deltaproteobacteria bacterium]
MIRGTTRLAAVIGWPVEHSCSPQMLNAAFEACGIDAVLVPIGVPPDQLATAVAGLRAARALGASVTIPHKVAVVALCDSLSPAARAIGAVNCLQFTETEIVGHNTDCEGFVDSLVEAGCTRPPDVVLLGAGGATRAIAFALRAANRITIVARNPDRVSWVGAMLKVVVRPNNVLVVRPWTEIRSALEQADLVVDCTSIGLGRDEGEMTDSIPLDAVRREAWVATLVYHRPTLLLERARERGHPTLDGRGMLVHQGARAFGIWTTMTAPVDAMRQALENALRGT